MGWRRHLKTWVRAAEIAAIEYWLNIDTRSMIEDKGRRLDGDPGRHEYESLDYHFLMRCLRPLALRRDDVVYDIGCGAGRILCLAARMSVRKVVGIELLPILAEVAERNLARLRGRRSDYEIRRCDAAFAEHGDGTVYILFNPFREATLAAVLARIQQGVRCSPRRVRFLYLNPAYERAFDQSGWLTCAGRKHILGYRTRASYWTNASAVRPSGPVGRI